MQHAQTKEGAATAMAAPEKNTSYKTNSKAHAPAGQYDRIRPATSFEVIDQFTKAMQDAGLAPPDAINADGQLHRFSTNGRAGDKAGYYALHIDATPGGFFGCWREQIYSTWSSRDGGRLTTPDRERLAAAIDAARVERERRYEERASFALQLWENSNAADPNHPYLARKGIAPAGGIRQATQIDRTAWFDDPELTGHIRDCLLVPVRGADGRLQSIQAITPAGDKWYLKGGRMAGGMLTLPGRERSIFVAEGYATATSVNAATGATTIVAFSAGNLHAAAQSARSLYPAARLVIAADNDHRSPKNAGLQAANEAATALDIEVAAPTFAPEETGKDWNDYAAAHGLNAVHEAMRERLQADNDNAPSSRHFQFLNVGDLVQHLKPIDWLVKGYVERDSMAVIYGEPGHGKSFVAIDVACSVATGTDWHGCTVKPGAVFYIAGEGHNGLARRFRAWSEARGVSLAGAPLYISNRSVALTDSLNAAEVSASVYELAKATCETPSLIVVDTLARNFGAGDENSAADMGAFVTNLDNNLRHPWKATVAIVHHSGKDTSKGARGSTALRGAVDAEYEVTKDELGTIRMQPHKMKDAENPEPLAFTLESVPLPLVDEDGRPVYGAAIKSMDYIEPPKKGREGTGKNQTQAIMALRELYTEQRQRLEDKDYDPDSARVSLDDWRNRCAFPHRNSFYKVKESLLESGKIQIIAGHVELVDR